MHTPVYKHKNITNSLPELEVVCESGDHCFVAWLNSVKLCFTKHNLLTMWWELIVKLTHPHSENWISQRSKLDFCAPPHLWCHATTQLSLSMTSVLFIIHLLPVSFFPVSLTLPPLWDHFHLGLEYWWPKAVQRASITVNLSNKFWKMR